MTPRVVTNAHEERARQAKAGRLAAFLLANHNGILEPDYPDFEGLKGMDSDWWKANAEKAGVSKPSETTIQVIVEHVRAALADRSKDPSEGLGKPVEPTYGGRAMTEKTREPIGSCPDCGRDWTTHGEAHCAAPGCCQHFTSDSGFDAHRSDGECRDPATLAIKKGPRKGQLIFESTTRASGPCWKLAGEVDPGFFSKHRGERAKGLDADSPTLGASRVSEGSERRSLTGARL